MNTSNIPCGWSLKPAFTIVELLVVVGVIIVLVAILLPSLESGRYQAKLAKCATQQKTIGDASRSYAADNLTYYPNRDNGNQWDGDPMMVRWVKGSLNFDQREKFKPYMNIAVFSDPLMDGPKLDDPKYDDPNVTLDQRPNLMGDYAIFGGLHRKSKGFQAMERVGQKIEIADWSTTTANPPRRLYNLLTADWDLYRNGTARANHPDISSPAVMRIRTAGYQPGGDNVQSNRWIAGNSASRPVDLNFGYADGSVKRLSQVERKMALTDPRMNAVRLTYAYEERPSTDHPGHFQDIDQPSKVNPANNPPNSALSSVYFQIPKE